MLWYRVTPFHYWPRSLIHAEDMYMIRGGGCNPGYQHSTELGVVIFMSSETDNKSILYIEELTNHE